MKYLIFLSLFFLSNSAIAQQTRVKYVDGTYFNGEVLSDTAEELTLLTYRGDTIRINQAYIEKRYVYPESALLFNKGKFHFTEGWFLYVGTGVGLGNSVNGQFDALLGRRINKNWVAGFDFSFQQYFPNFSFRVTDDFFTPSLYGRRYLTEKRTRLFIDTNIGYGLALEGTEFGVVERVQSNGFFAAGSLGIHFASRNKTKFLLSLGQNFQYSKGSFTENVFINEQPRTVSYDIWYARPMLRFGIEFF
jgi:hypothetical protein